MKFRWENDGRRHREAAPWLLVQVVATSPSSSSLSRLSIPFFFKKYTFKETLTFCFDTQHDAKDEMMIERALLFFLGESAASRSSRQDEQQS